MRTLKTFVLTLAVALTVCTGSLMAAGPGGWTKVPVQTLPFKIMEGYHRLFSHDKILRAEKSGTGADVRYRLTLHRHGKPKEVLFNAEGQTVR